MNSSNQATPANQLQQIGAHMIPITTCSTETLSMTSREIAELVESRHDSVKRAVERLIERGTIAQPPMVDGDKSANGVTEKMYLIGKRDSYVIVAQLSPEFTARLVDRWQELESAKTRPAELTRLQLIELALSSERERIALAEKVAADAPAVAFVEKYVDATGCKGFRQVCKLLGANESSFREFLLDKKIMYRLGGEWVPFADHLAAGRFVVKTGTSEKSTHAFNQALFTAKGVSWIAGEWARYQIVDQEAV